MGKSFNSSFLICMTFSCLDAPIRISSAMLKRSDENRHSCLFQSLAESLQFFTIEYYVVCGFVINSFHYVEICSLCTNFGKGFYHEWMLNFIRCFCCIYWDDHVVLTFSFVDVVYHIDWLVFIEPSLWPWDESNLIVVYDLFFFF